MYFTTHLLRLRFSTAVERREIADFTAVSLLPSQRERNGVKMYHFLGECRK